MKHDMGGAAAAAGAIIGAALTKSPLNVSCVIPLCENAISGAAQKPGDISYSMKGLTVEIEDTDAEGRLILADALYFAQKKFSPKTIIDIATLTGAMCVALGPLASGVYVNDEQLWNVLYNSSRSAGDKIWRMPLWDEYREYLKSDVADLKNLGIRDGGSNSAAIFLKQFINDGQRWAHIDMAPVMKASSYYEIKDRATGRPTRLLLELLSREI